MSRNRSPWSESAHEGLPQADDYDPAAIGTASVEAGDPEQTWPDFGLELVPVLMDGTDTGRRFLRRNGDYLADVSDQYQLLPNERAVEAANHVADELGAVPFHEFSGDWYVNLDDHVFQDQDRRRVHALYAWDSRSVGGDSVDYGFAVHNSIDASMTFQVGLFTFNRACANMVMMGVDGQGMHFDGREVLAHSSHKHTSGLEIEEESLAERVRATLMLVDNVDENYRRWRDEFVTVGHIEDLIQRFPTSDLPEWMQDVEEHLGSAEENEDLDGGVDDLSPERRRRIIRDGMKADADIWETYNDLTESIWHSPNQDTTKQRKFNKLHRVFDPITVED